MRGRKCTRHVSSALFLMAAVNSSFLVQRPQCWVSVMVVISVIKKKNKLASFFSDITRLTSLYSKQGVADAPPVQFSIKLTVILYWIRIWCRYVVTIRWIAWHMAMKGSMC